MPRFARAFVHGILTVTVLLLGVIAVLAVQALQQYTGQCGGLLPFIGQAYACSRATYVGQMLTLTLPLLLDAYWPLGVLVGFVAGVVSYVRSR